MHDERHFNPRWEHTSLELDACDRITQDGFQKEVERGPLNARFVFCRGGFRLQI